MKHFRENFPQTNLLNNLYLKLNTEYKMNIEQGKTDKESFVNINTFLSSFKYPSMTTTEGKELLIQIDSLLTTTQHLISNKINNL